MAIIKNKKKQSTWHRYTIIALFVALLACIATVFFGVSKLMVNLELYTPQSPETLNNALWISAGTIILGIAAYLVMEPDRVRQLLTGRQARYGSNALIMSLAFVGILVVGNMLAFQYPVSLADLTEDQVNTLAPETLAALKTLPEKVTAIGFFSQTMSTKTADQLLRNLKAQSNGRFDYQFIDPNRDPQAARNAGITGDGKILLRMGDRQEIAAYADESEILKAMIRLISQDEHVVYFLTGHGEKDIEQPGETSMTRAKATLESKNYTVKTLNLQAENQIPEDANVIIIAGPIKPVSTDEVSLLREYLTSGGSLIVMEDPIPLTDFGNESDPLAEMLAEDWGIKIDNDIVIDLNRPDPTTAVSYYYDSSHAITRNMNNLGTYFPFTRSLSPSAAVEGVTLNQLVQTIENSWGETDFEGLTQGGSQIGFDEGMETLGPLTLAIAGENSTTGGRVLVFGTSKLATDQIFDVLGNGDLFINSVDWSAEQENLTNITPKEPIQRTFLPVPQLRLLLIMAVVVLLIPGLVIGMGIFAWISRRRQG